MAWGRTAPVESGKARLVDLWPCVFSTAIAAIGLDLQTYFAIAAIGVWIPFPRISTFNRQRVFHFLLGGSTALKVCAWW